MFNSCGCQWVCACVCVYLWVCARTKEMDQLYRLRSKLREEELAGEWRLDGCVMMSGETKVKQTYEFDLINYFFIFLFFKFILVLLLIIGFPGYG